MNKSFLPARLAHFIALIMVFSSSSSLLVSAQSEGDEEEISGESEEKTVSPEELRAESWKLLEDPKYNISIQVPGKPWDAQTRDEEEPRQPGLGCAPSGGMGENNIVMAQNSAAQAGLSLGYTEGGFVFRQASELTDYLDERLEVMKEQAGEELDVVISDLEIENGIAVYHLEFLSPLPAGGLGGCRAGETEGEDERVHYVLKEYFVMPKGENTGEIFRTVAVSAETSFSFLEEDLLKFVDSFSYEGDTEEDLFRPEAETAKAPEIPRGGAGKMSWMIIAVMVAVAVYLFMKRFKKKQSPEA